MAKTKFIRVATEGDTTDGRKISREWIEQAANNFDPEKYGARVWLEHYRGITPDSIFRAFGDVVAVKAEENNEGKMTLYAQIDPTEDLIEMNKARQKVYTSIEIDPDFAGSGEAYLVGLAVTDSPASLGTEMLQFSAKAQNNPLNARKQRPENLFTAAVEASIEMEEESNEDSKSLFSKIKELLSKSEARDESKSEHKFADINEAVSLLAKRSAEDMNRVQTLSDQVAELQGMIDKLNTMHDEAVEAFNELKDQLESEPAGTSRARATGANTESADCL